MPMRTTILQHRRATLRVAKRHQRLIEQLQAQRPAGPQIAAAANGIPMLVQRRRCVGRFRRVQK